MFKTIFSQNFTRRVQAWLPRPWFPSCRDTSRVPWPAPTITRVSPSSACSSPTTCGSRVSRLGQSTGLPSAPWPTSTWSRHGEATSFSSTWSPSTCSSWWFADDTLIGSTLRTPPFTLSERFSPCRSPSSGSCPCKHLSTCWWVKCRNFCSKNKNWKK